MADVDVRHDPDQNRYVAYLASGDGSVPAGVAHYTRDGDAVVLTHTKVEPEHEGEGVGSALARGVLDDLRQRGERVVARCPFVAEYVRRHPDYQDGVELADG